MKRKPRDQGPGCTVVSRSRYYPGRRRVPRIPALGRPANYRLHLALDGEQEYEDAVTPTADRLNYTRALAIASAWRNDGRRRRWSVARRERSCAGMRAFDAFVRRIARSV